MKSVQILGVNISQITMEEAVKTVDLWLQDKKPRFVVTPNPEMLVLAQKDIEFKKILNSADMAIPDGAGLLWANKNLKERVSGTDLMIKLCDLAEKKGYSVGLLGAEDWVKEKAIKVLKSKFPNLNCLDETSADLVFVAYGAPKQEKWIFSQITQIRQISPIRPIVFMGVGGAFDFISGKVKRAPKLMQNIGLEWLWRLIWQPWRVKRILNATIIFPLLLIIESLKIHWKLKIMLY